MARKQITGADRVTIIRDLKRIAKKAEEAGNFKVAVDALKQVAEIQGLAKGTPLEEDTPTGPSFGNPTKSES